MARLGAVAAACAGLVLALVLLVVVIATGGPRGGDGGQGLPGVVCAAPGGSPGQPVPGFAADQLTNASAIVAAGDEVGVPRRAQVIAVATAMQESGLRNLTYGDRDSLGLFQQRSNWGPVAVREAPRSAAKLFYSRLLAVAGWASLPLTVAAQRVQASSLPDAYAKWEAKADQLVGAALGITCQPAGTGGPPGGGPGGTPGQTPPGDPLAQQVMARALAQVGLPYAWGGGNASGPTRGISDGGGAADRAGDSRKIGFDCSGLMVYAFAGIGITVPHQTQAIWAAFGPPITDRAQIQPGDMIMLSGNGQPSGIDHVGLYLGGGRAVDAPESGTSVRIEPNIWANPYWSTHFVGALRPTASAAHKA
jgi:cell wall-associated NlpC family hydrolase